MDVLGSDPEFPIERSPYLTGFTYEIGKHNGVGLFWEIESLSLWEPGFERSSCSVALRVILGSTRDCRLVIVEREPSFPEGAGQSR